ncbi:MAG: hypothetical protein ABFD79_14630 [Phycisphaerales bacterium]
MIDKERLERLNKDSESTIKLAIECAKKGHNHVVQSHTISSIELLELTSELLNFRKKFGEFEGIEK